MLYQNRARAGRVLAASLMRYAGRPDLLVLALPRGGVPVAYEVAGALIAPLDVHLVRMLGVPGYPELTLGAVPSGGTRILNRPVIKALGFSKDRLDAVTVAQLRLLELQEYACRGDRPPPVVRGKTVILVGDGLASDSTMRAAISSLAQQAPARLVVAVPIATPETCEKLQPMVDEVVCAVAPWPFYAVGGWYEDLSSTSDEEIRVLLQRAAERQIVAQIPVEATRQATSMAAR